MKQFYALSFQGDPVGELVPVGDKLALTNLIKEMCDFMNDYFAAGGLPDGSVEICKVDETDEYINTVFAVSAAHWKKGLDSEKH